MTIESLTVPDLGGAEQVEVIEILVVVGDQVAAEEGIIVLETDKATMEIPSPFDGTISSLSLKVGDKLNEGDQYGEIETAASGSSSPVNSDASTKPEDQKQEAINLDDKKSETIQEPVSDSNIAADVGKSSSTRIDIIPVPDLGGSDQVEVIELLVKIGEEVDAEQSVLTLETDKASMEIPAGKAGRVEKILLTLGDKVSVGDAMIELRVSESPAKAESEPPLQSAEQSVAVSAPDISSAHKNDTPIVSPQVDDIKPSGKVHAGPAVRKLAREFGVDLSLVKGKGVRGRVTKDDVQSHVKNALQNPTISGSGIPKVAKIDFSKFGEIETLALNKIKLATAKNMTAAWLNVPQVTQFDEADITELEAFRKQINSTPNTEQKLSAVPFVMKALASAMKEFPQFNASLSPDGQSLIYKKYLNIGVAVDTPNGLLVPVIRDVDKKSIIEIAKDLTDKAQKARAGKLGLADMQGGCLSVSSLGGIGGTAFTPIVNAPEVAILGLSRADIKPVWNGSDFVPKLMLPLSLSYDHRVIDGAEAARFSQRLAMLLGDIRHLIL
ncbi:MAG: pyruvate dehydrogenase E2 component (dihydrolipoamide acetyltransferase) [Oleispira sp.]|jgi:pyruvate dehydrogenase E2 component (dihydrolipoamide acetyltransferase)